MSDPLARKAHRREPMDLQLTAMIDVFSMIVIFLIFGTVFGAAEMVIPGALKLPQSYSKESVEAAPRVVIMPDSVQTNLLKDSITPDLFHRVQGAPYGASLIQAEKLLKAYVEGLSKENRATGTLLNVIADRETPYEKVYDVISFFREAGFDTLLFVASGESASKQGKKSE